MVNTVPSRCTSPWSGWSSGAAAGPTPPILLINKITALGTGPVSGVTLSEPFRGQAATLEQLRVDRQLEEALAHGPDPLHLAEVFGLDEKTAIRYANSARARGVLNRGSGNAMTLRNKVIPDGGLHDTGLYGASPTARDGLEQIRS
ncbi:hypothetical protein ACM614_16195 [Streptomyces sp. 12297]